jgi:hypothetical protein
MPRAFSLFLAPLLAVVFAAPLLDAAEPVRFGIDVLPILSDACFHCHGPDPKHREADLRLDDRDAALKHGAFVPGKSRESEIIRRMTSTDPDEQMPPPDSNRKVTAKQIDVIRRWIDAGAEWGKHWAYETPRRPALPKVKLTGWPRNAIDYFVLARLEREGLRPSPEASKETLLRRVSLDLTGLPPTPEELDAFLLDSRPDAYEHAVDRLLASPRYGVRWAWDWLDAARYADTGGYQGDPERTMWPWRDWVVRAINENMPYDRFTIEQLAGDLLPNATVDQRLATAFNRNHMFNAEGGRIPEETRVENVMDRLETTGTVWLGLTIGCARCHDHKYDPVTNREYYQFYAYFNNTSESGSGRSGQATPVLDFASDEDRKRTQQAEKQLKTAAAEVAATELKLFPREEGQPANRSPKAADLSGNDLAALGLDPQKRGADALRELANYFQKREPEYGKQLAHLKKAVEERDRAAARTPRVMVMDDLEAPRETFILDKGAYDKPKEKVGPGLFAALPPLGKGDPNNRLGLARWLVAAENPLTARVTVNRFWQAFFGTGLVKTAEDFGVQGEIPSHPELLDWLAMEFKEGARRQALGASGKTDSASATSAWQLAPSAWNVKALQRLIVTSATYRQSSRTTRTAWERDPDNRLLARGPRFRLPSWMLRDQALAVAGLLVEKEGGPSVKPYQPEGIWEEATFGKKSYTQDHGESLYRRSLYIFWRRIVGPTMFFDVSARQVCAAKAIRTNTPLHALTTLNDVTYVEAARALAERALHDGGSTTDERIAWSFRRVVGRYPNADEARTLAASFATLRARYAADPPAAEKLLTVGESPRDAKLNPIDHAAHTALCTMILNLDETLTKQ